MTIIFWTIVFILSVFVLVKASDFFTDSAEKLGIYIGLPAFLVGVTIVAIGTSLPELITSIIAVAKKSSEIVAGNIIGSNITNILLIVGAIAIISKKITIKHDIVKIDLPILISATFLFAIMSLDGKISIREAILLTFSAIIYLIYVSSMQKKRQLKEEQAEIKKVIKKELEPEKKKWEKDLVTLLVSAAFVYIGAKYTIDSVIKLSEILNVGKEIIAITAVALGTSLPELAVSLSAVKHNKSDLALGNILGSNIFNITAVGGIAGIIGTITIPPSILSYSLLIMIAASILYFFIIQDKEVTQWEGWLLIIIYIVFIGNLFHIL